MGSGGAGAKDSVPASEELRAPSGGEGQCARSVEVTHAAERALAVGEKDPHGPRVLVLRPRACRLVSLNRRRLICKTGNFFFFTAGEGRNQVKNSSLAGLVQGTQRWSFSLGFFRFRCREPTLASSHYREEDYETRARFRGTPGAAQEQDELQGTATMSCASLKGLPRHHLPFLFLPNQPPFETQSCYLPLYPRVTALVWHLYYHLAKVLAPNGILRFLSALSSHSRAGKSYRSS